MEQIADRYEAAGAPTRPAEWGEDEQRSVRMSGQSAEPLIFRHLREEVYR